MLLEILFPKMGKHKLIHLLKTNPEIRQLISEICSSGASVTQEVKPKQENTLETELRHTKQQIQVLQTRLKDSAQQLQTLQNNLKHQESEAQTLKNERDHWKKQAQVFPEYRACLDWLARQPPELQNLFCGRHAPKSPEALEVFLARCSQWEVLNHLWDTLRDQLKTDKRPVTKEEQSLLELCLRSHNLIHDQYRAELISVNSPIAYDIESHQRVGTRGEKVIQVYLPGLRSASGQLVKKPRNSTGKSSDPADLSHGGAGDRSHRSQRNRI